MSTQIKTQTDKAAKIAFPVSGMTCAACQARVQRALTAEAGVIDASVNLVTRSAAVQYDPSAVTPQRLVAAVRATGYDAELTQADEDVLAASSGDDAETREARSLAVRATVSVIAGIVAMSVSMGSMNSMGNAGLNYFLLALTTAILVWAGRGIYRSAWTAVRHRSADMNTLVALGTGSAFIYS